MVIAVLQARTSSSRLPGKVLKELCGKPMILWQIERIRQAQSLEGLLVATSTNSSDDCLAALCEEQGIPVFRGSLDDVLDRFYQATKTVEKARHVVRLTGDCPLLDPKLLDKIVAVHLKGQYDYTSNTLEPTFPDGLDVEVMRTEALKAAWEQATSVPEREHVTYYIYQHPEQFRLGSFEGEPDYSGLRWTVDEEADFRFVEAVYQELIPRYGSRFSWQEVLELLQEKPELTAINHGFLRNEGLTKSLEAETKK